MSTIHIHPTVSCDPAAIFKLQRRTGMLVVIRGSSVRLVSVDQSSMERESRRRLARSMMNILNGNNDRTPPTGPEAA